MTMSDFKVFADAISRQFAEMVKEGTLFTTDCNKEILYETYLESFPTGTNEIYKERRGYDCNACKSFIRRAGGLVAFKAVYRNNPKPENIMTVWDTARYLDIEEYAVVAKAMREYVISRSVLNVFLSPEPSAGVLKNVSREENGNIVTWYHFFVNFPKEVVVNGEDIGTKTSELRSSYDIFLRGMEEPTLDAIDTTLELIAQNSLYRGEEHQHNLECYRNLKKEFDAISAGEAKRNVAAMVAAKLKPNISRLRNTSIGQLLINLSEGMDMEMAVKKFEQMVAPANYKRPTALITNAMIERARQTCDELGLTSALDRRHAVIEDIRVNDILFADRSISNLQTKNGFDALQAGVPDKAPKNMDKVEEVTIEKFLSDIVPKAESLEIMLEGRHEKNLFSLIAPVDLTAGHLFPWNNNFSWSYNGDLADSAILQRVKAAGGNVEGELCFRLGWFNYDDLDLHMREPDQYDIHYGNARRLSPSGGMLDVDMNVQPTTRNAVENIFYSTCGQMKEGIYTLYVQNFTFRESHDAGFEVEMQYKGETTSMSYDKIVKNKENIEVLKFEYTRAGGVRILQSLPASTVTKEIWGINTNKFHKVTLAMFSPNYWEDSGSNTGNKHYMFVLDGCKNPNPTRGFYNEFLRGEFHEHRKVFEILGSKMRAEPVDKQLSGLGFSSTVRESVTFRVKGNFNRMLKVTF